MAFNRAYHMPSNLNCLNCADPRKKLVLAYNEVQYRLFLRDSGLSPDRAEYVTDPECLRGIGPDKFELVYLPQWRRNERFEPLNRITQAIALFEARGR